MANKFLIICGGSGRGLLGQRTLLGLDGELYLDVSKEANGSGADTRSMRHKLDEPIGAIQFLLYDIQDRIDKNSSRPAGQSVYIDTKIRGSEAIKHAEFIANFWHPHENLAEGMSQSPTIGGSAIRQASNVQTLRNNLNTIATQWATAVGPNNAIEVWIVSSTAGGTGEGTHRFVAAQMADVFNAYGAPINFHFIRVGPLTFRSINYRNTMINSFFGIAADAAFAQQIPIDFPGITTRWYYVDLPDVGNETNKRADLVNMASRALMSGELQQRLGLLINNNAGIPMVPTRIGYWGTDFGESRMYYEVLNQLIDKLRNLIVPSAGDNYISARRPRYINNSRLTQLLAGNTLGELFTAKRNTKPAWTFPKVPDNFTVTYESLEAWTQHLNELIGPNYSIEGLMGSFEEPEAQAQTTEQGGPSYTEVTVPEKRPQTESLELIVGAQRAQAWCRRAFNKGLEDDPETNGLLAKLATAIRACSDAEHQRFKGTEARAREVLVLLPPFVDLLVKVKHISDINRHATEILNEQLQRPQEVLSRAVNEAEIVGRTIPKGSKCPVLAADLQDTHLDLLYGRTWLAMLEEAIATEKRREPSIFRREVLRGAVGVTPQGLLNLLRINSPSQVKETLRNNVGQMLLPDPSRRGQETTYEAYWWQSSTPSDPPPTLSYQIRVLPKLEESLTASDQLDIRENDETGYLEGVDNNIIYVMSQRGVAGLYVLAFEGVSMAQGREDHVTAVSYLLRPFLEVVNQELEKWVSTPVALNLGGQVAIATAGVIGEPLFKPAIEDALRRHKVLRFQQPQIDAFIAKLSEYYTFYP